MKFDVVRAVEQLERWLQLHQADRAASRAFDRGAPLDLRFDELLEAEAVVIEAVLSRVTPS